MQDIIFSVQLRFGKRKGESDVGNSDKINVEGDVGGIEKWLNTAQQIVKNLRKKG